VEFLKNNQSRLCSLRPPLDPVAERGVSWSPVAPGRRISPPANAGNISGWPRGGWLILLVIFLGPFSAPLRGQAFKEYDLKAAFLYHLAQFVEWPPEAFPETETPLVIGVLGQDPFGKALDEMVQNEVVRNRKLVVHRFRQLDEIRICHVLFISQSEEGRLDQILSNLKGRNILTVGDTEGFARRGGIVRFLTEKNKIRMRINIETANAANLTISSKLLRASEVIGSKETKP